MATTLVTFRVEGKPYALPAAEHEPEVDQEWKELGTPLRIWVDEQTPAEIDGRFVKKIAWSAKERKARVTLEFESPLNGRSNSELAQPITLELSRGVGDPSWTVKTERLPWCCYKKARGAAPLGGWFQWSRTGEDWSFRFCEDFYPVETLGICRKDTSKALYLNYGCLGLLRSDSELFLAFVPFRAVNQGVYKYFDKGKGPKLLLPLLGEVELNVSEEDPRHREFKATPLLFLLPLSPGHAAAWRLLIKWEPAPLHTDAKAVGLAADRVLGRLWNPIVRGLFAGMRADQAGTGWTALPELALSSEAGLIPLIDCEIGSTAVGVRHVEFFKGTAGPTPKLSATFSWRTTDTRASLECMQDDRPSAQTPRIREVTVEGDLDDVSVGPEPTFGTWPELENWGDGGGGNPRRLPLRERFVSRIFELQQEWRDRDLSDPLLLSLRSRTMTIPGADGRPPSEDEYLAFGSLQLLPDRRSGFEMQVKVRGAWSSETIDIHPELEVHGLPCRVRFAPTADPDFVQLRATLDSAGQLERELESETEPILFEGGSEAGASAQLYIRTKGEPGRDRTTELLLTSTERLKEKSRIYFQAKPFLIARVEPPDLSPETGSILAYWRSDDPEGPQWRIADPTIALDLPPQAVAEEMERGARFWNESAGQPKPYIEAESPLRYRFAPPTRLVVRPSVVRRRYHPVPNNLARALDGGIVESFRTEMVYPVSIRFSQDERGLPDIRIAETAHFLGRPTAHLPPAVGEARERARLLRELLSEELGVWASRLGEGDSEQVAGRIAALRGRQAANRANFASRLGKYHLFDPRLADARLHLQDGLEFRIRDTGHGAPPLLSPLARFARSAPENNPVSGVRAKPSWTPQPIDLTAEQKGRIAPFLKPDKPGGSRDWGSYADGALRAGVLHTIEFPSELVAVLRDPTSQRGLIESLSFSALGASGSMAVSFDEGRTTFVAESVEGQLTRLVKIRIGRAGVLWNRARHVIVYERSVVPSRQFSDEQVLEDLQTKLGWPILRKNEEFVEPIERVREFGAEPDYALNVTAFLEASEFKTPRIHVNGAWGRDLGHGYEIPLWNPSDSSGFYPKPTIGLRARAGEGPRTFLAFEDPNELVFYSNTEPGTGSDTDRWLAKSAVDAPEGPIRLGLITTCGEATEAWKDVLDAPRRPGARRDGARRQRFDLRVVPDGHVDLMTGRGSEPVLATLGAVSLARTAEAEASGASDRALAQVGALQRAAEKISQPAEEVRQFVRTVDATLLQFDCDRLRGELQKKLEGTRQRLERALDDLAMPSTGLADGDLRGDLEESLAGRLSDALEPLRFLEAAETALNEVLESSLAAWRRGAVEASKQVLEHCLEAVSRLEAAHEAVQRVVDRASTDATASANAIDLLAGALGDPSGALLGVLAKSIADNQGKWDSEAVAAVRLQAGKAREQLGKAACVLPRTVTRILLSAVEQVEAFLLLVERFLQGGRLPEELGEALANATEDICAAVASALQTLKSAISVLRDGAASNPLKATAKRIWKTRNALKTAALPPGVSWETLEAARTAFQRDVNGEVRTIHAELSGTLAGIQNLVIAPLGPVEQSVVRAAAVLSKAFTDFWEGAKEWSDDWSRGVLREATKLVEDTASPCDELHEFQGELRAALGKAESEVRRSVSSVATGLLDETARAKLERLAKDSDIRERVGAGLKVAKAIGELAEIAPLTRNVDVAEFLFADDPAKAIEMTPCAVKFGELAAGLQGLGLTVPSRRIFGQLLPEAVDGLAFGDVFKSLGGIRFEGLFPDFLKIPKLSPDQVQIAHGLDRGARSAWVRARVNVEYPEARTLFGDSTLGVRLERMHLRAESEARVAADGGRQARTDGSLTADWMLAFGGNRLITFREVTLRFDGSRIAFDLDPKRVELHPALRFVSEFVQAVGKRVPPSVQVEKDERGVPVGARTTLSTVIDRQNWGAVVIGPLAIRGGLGMSLRNGEFSVAAHFSLGSARAPIFVQIGWLGGGLWLESVARFEAGTLDYSAEVGLALGAARSFDVAGIARGSFSFLLFASGRFRATGGAFRAGLSIEGSAQILGIARAYIGLLLEVVHSGGSASGHGTLDVEIEICWCYTLSVHRQVTQAL